jgi:SSS family solute:Na+ symporter
MTIIKIIISVYLSGMLLIGLFSFFRIRSFADYYVSGKKGAWWQITGSLFATIVGGSALLGTVEMAQKAGWSAIWFLGSASAGLVVLAFIAPRVRQLGRYTLPEMIRLFYGQKADRVASVMIPVAWLGIIAVQIIAGGKILSAVNLMTYPQGAALCAAIFIVYTLLGGQKSIIQTDFVQGLIILVTLIVLSVLQVSTSGSGKATELFHFSLFNSQFGWTDLLILLLTYSVTFVVGPDIYSRIFCAKDDKTARRSVLLTAILVLITAGLLTYLTLAFSSGPGSGKLIFQGDATLPSWAIGLLVVLMLSAIMSSASATILTASMILSGLITGELDNKKSMILTRALVVVTGILALTLAIKVTSILSALLLSLTFFSGAFILPVIAGIRGWKVYKKRAFAAMIAGGLTALAGKILQEFLHLGWGYGLIIAAYLVNALILFSPFKKAPKKMDVLN